MESKHETKKGSDILRRNIEEGLRMLKKNVMHLLPEIN